MNLKNILLGIAIIILTSFVAIYGILTFYGESPQWDKYCINIRPTNYEINTSSECTALGGTWNPQYNDKYTAPIKTAPGYCDLYYECNQKLSDAQKIYSRNLFIITVPIGIILLVLGGYLFALEAVGGGIMGGGIITLIYGAGSYWPNAGNAFRFVISLIGLALVIIFAYWLNKKLEEEKKGFFKNLIKKKRR